MSKNYAVSKEFILEAHKSANLETRTRLEKQFPDLFEEEQLFQFIDDEVPHGRQFTTGVTSSTLPNGKTNPFMIGVGLVDEKYKGRVLLLINSYDDEYELKVVTGKELGISESSCINQGVVLIKKQK